MKYILMCVTALAACLGLGWIPAFCIGKLKKWKRRTTCFFTFVFSVLLICGVTFGYLSIYYHADESSQIHSETVQMKKIDGGYFFDGPGETDAMIFYPGAKVETIAYAPLMTALAENGVDCFLADLPFRMAMFGRNQADRFLNAYSYEHWTAAGHSMGGLVISGYASAHADQIQNLILLAAYPGSAIPDELSLCSIYGSQDGCLNMEAYQKAKQYWPSSFCEYILEGGNHAQYANYGPQSGDLKAMLTAEEQQAQTVKILNDFLS